MKNENKLPNFLVEGKGNYWIIWDTVNHLVVGTFETKESANEYLKTLI